MTDILEMTIQDLQDRIPDRDADWVLENFDLFEGNHWRDGYGWVGPQLNPDDEAAVTMMAQIKRAFTSKNIVREVVQRHVNALLKSDPVWTFSRDQALTETTSGETEQPQRFQSRIQAALQSPVGPAGQQGNQEIEDQLITEAEDLFRRWWTANQCLVEGIEELSSPRRALQSAVANALLCSRGPLRLFIPPKFLRRDENGSTLPVVTPDEAVKRIFLHVPDPNQSTVALDDETYRPFGIYTAEDERIYIPPTETLSPRKQVIVEVSYVDDSGMTHLTVFKQSEEEPDDISLPLNKNLFHHEVSLPLMIDETVRQNQKLYNMNLTMMGRNVVQAGFLERVLTNAQLPGREVINPNTGEKEFIPEALAVGPGVTTFVAGIEYEDGQGNIHYTDPNVIYREPVDTGTFIKTGDTIYRNILDSVDQLHVLGSSEANMSGESRQQARSEFESSLSASEQAIENTLTWLIKTVLSLIGLMSNNTSAFADLDISTKLFVDSGPLTTEEERGLIDLTDAKLMSRKTAMQRLGIQDTDEELEQITEEQNQDQQQSTLNLASILTRSQSPEQEFGQPGVTPGQAPGETPAERVLNAASTPEVA